MRVSDLGDNFADNQYELVGTTHSYKVNANNTTTPIVQIVVRSLKYDVTFMFNVTQATFDAEGAPALAQERTFEVNALAGHAHVVGVRGEEDQGPDGNLYNYLVLTVGTDDGEITTEVRVRMDHVGTIAATVAIEDAWSKLVALGAPA